MTSHTRAVVSVSLVIALFLTGVLGFRLIEGWTVQESVYMTLITLTTVGFQEVQPLSYAGRQFTIFFLVFALATVGYSISSVVSYVFEGQVVETMRARRNARELRSMKDHYIICGYGDIGHVIVEELRHYGRKFVVVDREADRFLHDPSNGTITHVTGDASEEHVLEEAGIARAKGLIAVLPHEQDNVFVVLSARQMNPDLQIVAKAAEERTARKLTKAGADRVISPAQIAGRRLTASLLRPSVVNFLDVVSDGGDVTLRIEEFAIGEGSPAAGHSLRELNIGQHTGAIVLSILDDCGVNRCAPSGSLNVSQLELRAGDKLIALGSEDQLLALDRFLQSGPIGEPTEG